MTLKLNEIAEHIHIHLKKMEKDVSHKYSQINCTPMRGLEHD